MNRCLQYRYCWIGIALLLGLFIWPDAITRAASGAADACFIKGNEHYQNGDYPAAIEQYNNILKMGYESWEVYYNLANACFKDGQLGLAVVNYERARRLNPKDEDINYNLELINLSIVDRIEKLPRFFLSAWISNIANAVNLPTLGMMMVFIYILFGVFFIVRVLNNSTVFVKPLFIATLTTGIMLLCISSLFVVRIIEVEKSVEAVVLADKVEVRSAPDEAGTEVFALHEGVKIRIQDRSLNWIEIKLADGKVGWIKENAVEVI
jgi:tetratricopeptide (TPR) repeat protein